MKKLLTILVLCMTLVCFSQKKKSSKAENDAIENEIRFMLECTAAHAYTNNHKLKTDTNLNDYLEFKICNDQTNKRVIGVVIAYQQKHMPIQETGRVKLNIAPKSIGYAKYYPSYKVNESMYDQLFVYKYIYSDGTTLKL